MCALRSDVDPDGLLEFSVVFTDRSLNHMSQSFQDVMHDISTSVCEVYNAETTVIVPGGGTYAMESVARQFATNKRVMILRNGWFSFRWTQIFDMGNIPAQASVLKAHRVENTHQSPFMPAPIDQVVDKIKAEKPDVVFAPHVETSSGIILPDHYISALTQAVHAYGGLFVLDCIASGCIWLDMKKLGVDVLISAPQKGWSASPCAGLVMMNDRAKQRIRETTSTSFSMNLVTWMEIMEAYTSGGHAYHATMPTDSIKGFRDTINEMRDYGFGRLEIAQQELGEKVRSLLTSHGYPSVAARGYEAPGVVVSYTDDSGMKNGSKFVKGGVQIATGVPLRCDEPDDYSTFRIGLFGLDKLYDVDATVERLARALEQINE